MEADASWMLDDARPEEPPPRRWSPWRLAAWAVALIVFEMTMDPSLVVVVGCSKFGWEQVRTAWWLRRSDPDGARGRTCGWFYLSWGSWRISLVALALLLVLILIIAGIENAVGMPARRGKAPSGQFIAAGLLTIFGPLVSTLLAVFGIVSGWSGRSKVWVGTEAIDARRAGAWPPRGPGRAMNRLALLTSAAAPLLIALLGLPVFLLAMALLDRAVKPLFGPAGPAILGGATMVGMFALTVVGPVVLLIFMDSVKRRMGALTPADCWPEGAGP